jgi:quinol monooxygenase YgiN
VIGVTGKVRATPAQREGLLAVADRQCELSRAEEGCLDYLE